MKKSFIMIAAILIIIAGTTTGFVNAQTTNDIPLSDLGFFLGFASFPAAGIYYATTGFAKKFARSLAGEKTLINYSKITRTTTLGIIVGVIAFIYTAYNGDIIHVTTLQQFLTQIAINLAAVMTVDRLILGGYAKPTGDKIET